MRANETALYPSQNVSVKKHTIQFRSKYGRQHGTLAHTEPLIGTQTRSSISIY